MRTVFFSTLALLVLGLAYVIIIGFSGR